MKVFLYIRKNLCYTNPAGYGQTMNIPLAQWREKAVSQYTTHPYLANGNNF